MFESLKYIELSGEKFPIKCDMVVLEKIQEEYGDLDLFEGKLNGFTPNRKEDGTIETNEEGLTIGTFGVPNIKTVNQTLIWMVQEGLEIEAEKENKTAETMDEKTILRKIDMSPGEIGRELHAEFMRCFARKNAVTTHGKKEKNPNK